MGKIIRLNSESQGVIEFLQDAIKQVENYDIDNVMIAFKLRTEDAYVMTGYKNLDMAEKQELLGHIQIDIIRDFIQENYITPD